MVIVRCFFDFFFVKQRTAYEMRISDWSSDVCSSDLPAPGDSGDVCVGKMTAQRQRGASVQLADPRLGHPENGADLGQRELLEVVERQDDLVPRSEERRGGRECVSTCRSRRSPDSLKKKKRATNGQMRAQE